MADEPIDQLESETEPTEEVEKTEEAETETVYEPVEGEQEINPQELKEKNDKLYLRVKKAEMELKRVKAEKAQLEATSKAANEIKAQIDPELIAREVRLLASLTDEEITEARDIAKGKNISLEEALKTKSFLAFQKELRNEEKREKAKLSASKGSSQEEQKSFARKGLTREEHEALWREQMGG